MGYPDDVLQLMDKITDRAGITNRHTVVADSADAYIARMKEPRARSAIWEAEVPALAVAAARDALARWGRGTAADVTHVVVHSCTGFGAPGIDHHLIMELGLASSTRKGERGGHYLISNALLLCFFCAICAATCLSCPLSCDA